MSVNSKKYNEKPALKQGLGLALLAALTGALVAGCQSTQPASVTPDWRNADEKASGITAGAAGGTKHEVEAIAGIKAEVSTDPNDKVDALAKKRYFATRTDPFSLLPEEARFDRQQAASRVVSDMGGFSMFYEEPEEKEAAGVIVEPTPAWRLSAVCIGEGVSAILVQTEPQGIVIRPGQKIQGTDWVVASIDGDRAILRRSGNKYPHEMVVKREASKSAPITPAAGRPTGGAPGLPGTTGGKKNLPGGMMPGGMAPE